MAFGYATLAPALRGCAALGDCASQQRV